MIIYDTNPEQMTVRAVSIFIGDDLDDLPRFPRITTMLDTSLSIDLYSAKFRLSPTNCRLDLECNVARAHASFPASWWRSVISNQRSGEQHPGLNPGRMI